MRSTSQRTLEEIHERDRRDSRAIHVAAGARSGCRGGGQHGDGTGRSGAARGDAGEEAERRRLSARRSSRVVELRCTRVNPRSPSATRQLRQHRLAHSTDCTYRVGNHIFAGFAGAAASAVERVPAAHFVLQLQDRKSRAACSVSAKKRIADVLADRDFREERPACSYRELHPSRKASRAGKDRLPKTRGRRAARAASQKWARISGSIISSAGLPIAHARDGDERNPSTGAALAQQRERVRNRVDREQSAETLEN